MEGDFDSMSDEEYEEEYGYEDENDDEEDDGYENENDDEEDDGYGYEDEEDDGYEDEEDDGYEDDSANNENNERDENDDEDETPIEINQNNNEQNKFITPAISATPSEIVSSELVLSNQPKNTNKTPSNIKKQDSVTVYGDNIFHRGIVAYQANEQVKSNIAYNEQNKFSEIEYQGRILLNEINNNGEICLWKHKTQFYYRSAQGNELHHGSKQEISDIITDFLGKPIKIVSLKDITKSNSIEHSITMKYIFTHQILAIEKEIFEPKEKEFFERNGVICKNLFFHTSYLKKRFDNQDNINYYDCFIIDFLDNISMEATQENKHISASIMNWISYFFQKMESSNIALVIDGSKKIAEEIFWKKLILPIFGNEEYCTTIDDTVLKKPIDAIVENKIFFHIVDFTPTEANQNKINQLLQGILIDKYVLSNSSPSQRVPVYGQVLITANQTISYMDEFYSQFGYVNIQNENEVIGSLAENIKDLSLKFTEKELDIFSTYLATFYRNTTGKLTVISKMNIINTTEPLEDKIQKFIQAIKNMDLKYFEKIKNKDVQLYRELEFAFSKECFIGQDLLLYFNLVYDQNIFKKNTQLLKVLKEKDKMFRQELTKLKVLNKNGIEEILFDGIPTYKEVGNKKLYKTIDYTLPENINVPDGSIIMNRYGVQRFKYNYSDIESAKRNYQQYDEENKKE